MTGSPVSFEPAVRGGTVKRSLAVVVVAHGLAAPDCAPRSVSHPLGGPNPLLRVSYAAMVGRFSRTEYNHRTYTSRGVRADVCVLAPRL